MLPHHLGVGADPVRAERLADIAVEVDGHGHWKFEVRLQTFLGRSPLHRSYRITAIISNRLESNIRFKLRQPS